MKKTLIQRFAVCALLLGLASPAVTWASTGPVDSTQITVQAIEKAYEAKLSSMEMPPAKAVAQLSGILMRQYGAKDAMSAEPDAGLKALYYPAATLLMNGYPIAGGTLVNAARHQPAIAHSPSGEALGAFVNTMLQPTDEGDDDLVVYQTRTKQALAHLTALPSYLQLPAQVTVVGEIYHDAIAVDAGKQALETLHADEAQLRVVDDARKASAEPTGH
jgi:hypothetical protein